VCVGERERERPMRDLDGRVLICRPSFSFFYYFRARSIQLELEVSCICTHTHTS